MPITLIDDGHTLVADAYGARVTFRRMNVEAYALAREQAAGDSAEKVDQLCEMIAGQLSDWDVLESDGTKAPLTAASVKRLPAAVATRLENLLLGYTEEGVVYPEGESTEGN